MLSVVFCFTIFVLFRNETNFIIYINNIYISVCVVYYAVLCAVACVAVFAVCAAAVCVYCISMKPAGLAGTPTVAR